MPKSIDSVQIFMNEHCIQDPHAKHMTAELYAAYVAWSDSLHDPKNPRTWHFQMGLIGFGMMLGKLGVGRSRYNGHSMWRGHRIP